MRPKIYIDTSVINGLFADDEPWIQERTKEFFKKVAQERYEIFISEEVDREIKATPEEEKRNLLLETLASYDFKRLKRSEEVERLADKYLKSKIFPKKYRGDALHVAIAVVNKQEVIASWNFKHIVKHSTRLKVNRINRKEGYPDIDICSPEEV